jgi:hypothetical protein
MQFPAFDSLQNAITFPTNIPFKQQFANGIILASVLRVAQFSSERTRIIWQDVRCTETAVVLSKSDVHAGQNKGTRQLDLRKMQ